MKSLVIILLVITTTQLGGQEPNVFTYPELDAQLITLWMHAERGEAKQLSMIYDDLQTSWQLSKDEISFKKLRHFDVDDFIDTQERIISEMRQQVVGKDYSELAANSYILLENFHEVRTYFTSDLYPLDELLSAFSLYDQLHEAVDDPMLGLFEWNDFIQLFIDFKKQFKRYSVLAEPGFDHEKHVLFKLAVQRVFDCSGEFELALKTAQQTNFIAPCDDTRDALIELIALYQDNGANL
jgi:hypothetical protein